MDKVILKDKKDGEPLLIIEGDEVTITEKLEKRRKRKRKEKEIDKDTREG